MDYLISAVAGIIISVVSWISAGYFWRFVDYCKSGIRCRGCSYKITEETNIFDGLETSYICPKCKYEGYA